MAETPTLADWTGRTETATDVAAAAPLAGLAATLDHAAPPWREGEVPPLGHWLFFAPDALQHEIAADGHPRKGGFLPPVTLPRRMWAGSRVTFHAPIPVGATITRRSTILSVEEKHGRSGPLTFVSVGHELLHGTTPCVTDVHDIVYREAPPLPAPAAAHHAATAPAGPPAAPADPSAAPAGAPEAEFARAVHPDPVLLFRYSALTFNGHRIHYDRGYCRDEEGYPGLVVHGPLTATLLMDLFLRQRPAARVTGFSFRGLRPIFDIAPFTVCGRMREGGATLWALGPDGQVAMRAELETA